MAENIVLKNRYSLGRQIAEDKLGIIYEGQLVPQGNKLTIREYHKAFCQMGIIERLQQAIFQLAALNHPHIVKIIDSVFTETQRFFIIYDTPPESTLAEILSKIGKFTESEALRMINIIGKAVEYAHQKKIIHGALTPENIIMCADGQVKIKNFYIDYLLNGFTLRQNGTVNDPIYLSPELLRGEPLKKYSDVFSLSAIAYRLLSGHTPYPEIENIPMLVRNLRRKPESLIVRNPDIPLYLEDIIFKSLEYNPAYRHQSILELLGDLQAKKVTIRVEEIKMREQMAEQKQLQEQQLAARSAKSTPAAGEAKDQEDNEINIPPINFQKRHRQIASGNYNKPMNNAPPSFKERPVAQTRPRRRFKSPVIPILVFSIFLGLIISIVQTLFSNYFNSIPKVEIPNVIGQPIEEANHALSKAGLKPRVIGQVVDNTVSENCVVSTIPEHGRVVKKYRLIKLYVSKGSEQMTVPALVESNINQIESIIKEKGFNLRVAERVYSAEFPPNIIISQNPEPHTPARKDSTISVVVSKGYPTTISLVDKNEDTAVVKVAAENLQSWEPQQIIIYLQDSKGRNKFFEKMLAPGEKIAKEVTTEPDAVIEIYYFNNLALKQELKNLEQK